MQIGGLFPFMDVTTWIGSVTDAATDVLVVNLFEGVTRPGGATGAVDQALGGLISEALEAGDFKGALGETAWFYTRGAIAARRVLLVGLGKADRFGLRQVRQAAAAAARAARKAGARSLATIAHGAGIGGLDPAAAAQFTIDGTLHGLYRFAGYKTGTRDEHPVATVTLVERDAARAGAMAAGARTGQVIAESANWARDLGNRPGNRLTAAMMAEEAAAMAAAVGLECEVHDLEGCRRLGLGLLLAVNQGSREEPRLIVLRYRGGGGPGETLGLVGKGITFDSGGISIKPTDGMWDMKYDMCGAAAVLGAMRAIALLRPPVDVIGVVAATDNMPDGGAYKPGDVIQGLSGKTVEIRSTDAEGRLVLADALAYAVRQGARRICTLSTLTGGVIVALGGVRFGMVANDDAWYAEVEAAVAAAGEKGWRLPNDDEYRELFKSKIADMTNGGSREASSVQGGLFLLQHVDGTPTVHFDIAGTAWGRDPNAEEQATGVGVRSLVALARRWGAR